MIYDSNSTWGVVCGVQLREVLMNKTNPKVIWYKISNNYKWKLFSEFCKRFILQINSKPA